MHDGRSPGIYGQIVRDPRLPSATRYAGARQDSGVKNLLPAFLNEVEATSCQEFECPGNKPLTSEAYALLFFNGQFLWERL